MQESSHYLDDLTGVLNRRFLREQLEPRVKDWIANQSPFSVVIVDIDHFKEINDIHGHLQGDSVIKEFANFIKKAMRGTDFVIRYGGDEFICIMPRTSKHDSEKVYQRLVKQLSEQNFAGLKLTVSAGIAGFPDDADNLETIIKFADSALYDAKRSGRNRVSVQGGRRAELPVRTFIDRFEEKDLIQRTIFDKGELKIIVVSGPLGIGKTRLTREVLSTIQGKEISWADCIPLIENIAYYPIRELIRYRIERYGMTIFESIPPAYKVEIFKLLPEYASDKDQLPEGTVALTDKYRLYESVKRILEFGERDKIFIVDNMQWIDTESIEVFKYLMRSLKARPITFIFIRRLEEKNESLQAFYSYLNREFQIQEMELKTFGDKDVREMLKAVLGDEPPQDLVIYIQTESGGVPFYIEEIIRELLRSRNLFTEGEKWIFEKPEKGIVPKTLTEIILQKCSGLNREANEVLELACVIGSFDISIIKEITGYNEGHILGLINDISRLGVVRYVRNKYTFNEAVTRNAIYQNFSDGPRSQMLHHAVGMAMEKLSRDKIDEISEDLAFHFYISRDIERGIKYCLKAAQIASNKYANSNALRYYFWALELLGEPSDDDTKRVFIDTIIKMSNILYRTGKHPQAQELLEKAEKYAKDMDDRKSLIKLKKEMGEHIMYLGNYSSAIEALNESITLAREEKDYASQVYALVSLGNAHRLHNNNEEALKAYQEACKIAEDIGDRVSAVRAMFNIGNIMLDDLRYNEALEKYETALKFHQEMKNKLSEGRALNNIGNLYEELGDYKNARKSYEQALKISQETGSRHDECLNSLNLANVNVEIGNRKNAFDFAQHGLKIAIDTGNPYDEILSRICLSSVQMEYGDCSKAMETLETALKMAESINLFNVNLHSLIGRCLIYLNEIDKASAHFKKIENVIETGTTGIGTIIDLSQWYFVIGDPIKLCQIKDMLKKKAQNAKSPKIDAEIEIMEANCCILNKDYPNAENHLYNALSLMEKIESPLNIGITNYRIAQLELLLSNTDKAKKHQEKALEIFKSIDAIPWIERTTNFKPITT